MYLNEILHLEKNNNSIKKIDLFLSTVNKKSLDYYKAFAYKNIILHTLGKTNEALQNLYEVIPNIQNVNSEAIIEICDAIITITIDVKEFSEAKKYINFKKEHLKFSNLNLNIIDEIKLALAKKDYESAINYAKKYLNDEVNSKDEIYAYEILAQIYYEIKDYSKYLEIASKLEKKYTDTLNTKSLINLNIHKLKIAYTNGNYIKVIYDGNNLIEDFDLDNQSLIIIGTMLIDSYLKSNDFKKAAIVESKYEALIDSVDKNVAIDFCKSSLDLYNKTNSLVSIKYYQDKINVLINEKKEPKHKHKQKDVIIPKTPENKEDVLVLDHIETSTHNYNSKVIAQNYLELTEFIKIINNYNENKFREVLRLALINLQKILKFEEAYLLYYNENYFGLHYKKDRVYDKKIEFENISETINFLAIASEEEKFLTKENSKNIVTNENYVNDTYGIAIPLFKNEIVYASIAFFANDEFLLEPLAYETIILASELINKSLIDDIRQQKLKQENKKLFFIYENMNLGIKELMGSQIHLSDNAQMIYGKSSDLLEVDFLSGIHSQDLPKYEAKLLEVTKYFGQNQDITYRYNKDGNIIYVKEIFYPTFENKTVLIYSLVEDVTLKIKEQQNLIDLAYCNPISKLPSELKLIIDIKEYLNKIKYTLVVLDIHDFKIYEELYGINFSNQLIYAVGVELKKALANNFNCLLYHLEFDRYAIIVKDSNDKRTIDNLLLKILNTTSTNLSILNKRLNIYFNCGICRISKSTNIAEDKVLTYAYEALNEAKKIKTLENHLLHYDSESTKLRFNENQLITHISEAIDHGKLGLSYKQVVNLKSKDIFAYYANISLDNFDVDSEYINIVVKRRNLENLIDKYVISNASKELKMLNDTIKNNLKIIIKLSNYTLDNLILDFINVQNNFFKTTKNRIIFYVDNACNINAEKLKADGYMLASNNPYDIYQNKIDYFIYDLNLINFDIYDDIKKSIGEKNIEIIVSNLNTIDQLNQAIEFNVDYVYGNYYKKSIRMKNLIKQLA